MMTLVERDALMLADMLTDEGIGPDEVDLDTVWRLVSQAGGYPTRLRRAYDQVYRRWADGGSTRDQIACFLLKYAHVAAAGAGNVIPEPGMSLDWSLDERPVWQVWMQYQHLDGYDETLSYDTGDRIASELRKTGMTRHVSVSIDDDNSGFGLVFRVHANDDAQASAVAEGLTRNSLERTGQTGDWAISDRSVTPHPALTTST